MGRTRDIAALRLRTLLHRGQVNQELDKEFQFHLEQLIQENIRSGMIARVARYTALAGHRTRPGQRLV